MTKGTIKEVYMLLKIGRFIGGAPMRFERYSFTLLLNDIMCRIGFKITGLYCGIFRAEKAAFEAVGGFVGKRAMEDVLTAKKLKLYGKSQGKKYGCLRRNFLINSTRKFDDIGDWLYFKMMFENIGIFIRAAFGDTEGLDKLFDRLFYDYNG